MTSIRMILLFINTKFDFPPEGKQFWITNLSEKLTTNDGKHIVFNKG